MASLKLIALDGDDLEVISAHLQDALINTGDILWRPAEHRVVVGVNRFDWEAAHKDTPEYRRCAAALRFERVLSCKSQNLEPGQQTVLNLLAIAFQEAVAPAGIVTLTFSGGGVVRLEVECLEAELADLGEVWTTAGCPDHSEVAVKQG